MDLFETLPTLSFETKTASVQLDEDPSMWPRQVLSELFRQVPEASEYVPRVVMIRTDPEQGYGLGAVVISSSTDSAMSTSDPGTSQKKQVLIPVIIKQHMLQPLDLLMTKNKMRPFTGSRLREALFRPATFELMTQDWGDQSLYNLFYPPGRAENDYGSGVSLTGGGNTPSAIFGSGMKYSMLEAIAPTLNKNDLTKLAYTIKNDPALSRQLRENRVFLGAVHKLAAREDTAFSDPSILFRKVEDSLHPDVVQMGYDEDRGQYWVKKASRGYVYRNKPIYMDRKEFLKFAGPVATKVDLEGTTTVSEPNQSVTPIDTEAEGWSEVEEPGLYVVKSVSGDEYTGWALPRLVDLDGVRVPLAVFTNGAVAAVQSSFLGKKVATADGLPSDIPAGTGVFYMTTASGIQATVPVTVVGQEAGQDGAEVYHVRTLTGGEYGLKMVPGLRTMVAGTEGGPVMLPASARFMALDTEKPVELVETADAVTKTASYVTSPKITAISDGLQFRFVYENMPKLASLYPLTMSYDDAVYVLCLAGADAKLAHTVLQDCSYESRTLYGVQDVRAARDLVIPSLEEGVKVAEETKALRRDLVKEAAVLPDIQTVDTVLSLSFVNPENVRLYVGFLPYLDRALSQVCELTLASRLGFNEVPEFAAARACRALNEVIEGLKALAMREIDESTAA